jgi:Flp pilus assembly protein TadG
MMNARANTSRKVVAEFAKNSDSVVTPLNSCEFNYEVERRSLRRLAIDEHGAAYTISYVMVIPVLMWLFCMIIECAIIANTKLGTVYAAYAAARTATVWLPATNAENANAKAQLAGVKAMAPFASGMRAGKIEPLPSADASAFLSAYHAYSTKTIQDKYVVNKFIYAEKHVRVQVEKPSSSVDNIKVTLTYEYPFMIPGVGRLLGKQGEDKNFYYPISTTVELTNEAPQEDVGTIGIGYGTLE